MGQLFETIRQLVSAENSVIGEHASDRLIERGIMEWQVVVGLDEGELIAERPDARPNPTVEIRESLPMAPNSKRFGLTCAKVVLPN